MPVTKPAVPALQLNAQATGLAYFAVMPASDGGGTTLHDFASSADDATVPSAIWGTGSFGGPCLDFAAAPKFALPSATPLAQTGDFSVSFRVKSADFSPAMTFVACYSNTSDLGWGVGSDDANSSKVKFFTKAGGVTTNFLSATALSTGTDHDIICTFNATTGVKQIFIDSVLDATSAADQLVPAYDSNSRAALGGLVTLSGPGLQDFNGTLDAVAVYSYVMPASGGARDSVAGIFADPFTAVRGSAVANYAFQDSFGSAPGSFIDANAGNGGSYLPTNLDGSTGSGTWTCPSGFTSFIITPANRVRVNGSNTSRWAFGSGVPISTEYGVKGTLKIVDTANTPYCFLVSHWDGTYDSPSAFIGSGYLFGLLVDAGGVISAVAVGYTPGSVADHLQTSLTLPGSAIGDEFALELATVKSGADLVVNCYLQRADGQYLVPGGGTPVYQATRATLYSWTETGPAQLARGLAGFRMSGIADDAAGIHLDNFAVPNYDGPATKFTATGPTSGTIGVPSASFTVAPDGITSETVTPSDGAGGTFVPASLTWAASDVPKTFTYAPAGSAGARTITLTPTALPSEPATLPFTAVVGPHATSALVYGSGNFLVIDYVDAAGNPANVISATGGVGTLTVTRAGTPTVYTLVNPLVAAATTHPYVGFVLRPTITYAYADDNNAGGSSLPGATAAFATAGGGWAEISHATTPFYPDGASVGRTGGYVAANDQYRVTSDPTGTATWTFTGLTDGPYDVIATLKMLRDPANTTRARYTCKDGAGATLATFDNVDQTADLPIDLPLYLMPGTKLGTVNLAGGTLAITVDNAAGAGQLVADAMYVELMPVVMQPGDTAVLDMPALAVVTAAGAASATHAMTVTLADDAVTMPFDAAAPRTLKVGYNKYRPNYQDGPGQTSYFYADLVKTLPALDIFIGTGTVDSDGKLTALSAGGLARAGMPNNSGNGIDNYGTTINQKSPATYRIIYDDTLGRDANYYVGDYTDVNAVGLAIVDHGTSVVGSTRVRSMTVTDPPYQPLSTATRKQYYTRSYPVTLYLGDVVTGLKMFDGDTPADWPYMTHPVAMGRFSGHNLGAIRMLDVFQNQGIVDYSDWGSPTQLGVSIAKPTLAANIVSIDPLQPGDLDLMPNMRYFGGVRITLDAPFPIKAGQSPVFLGLNYGDAHLSSSPGPSGAPGYLYFQNQEAFAFPIDATTILMQANYQDTAGSNDYPGPCATLAASFVPVGASLTFSQPRGSVPFWDQVTFCVETGVPLWLNLPDHATDACITQMATVNRDATTPGTPWYVEVGNEPWNDRQGSYRWNNVLQHQMAVAHAADPTGHPDNPQSWMQALAAKSIHWFALIKAVYAADSRGDRSADVVGVINSNAGDFGPLEVVLDWFFAKGARPDLISTANYQEFDPGGWANATTDAKAALDSCDINTAIDVYTLCSLRGDRQSKLIGQASLVDASKYGGYYAGIPFSAYEGGLDTLVWTDRYSPAPYCHAMYRHPRMYPLWLAWTQMQQFTAHATGHELVIMNKYVADYSDSLGGTANWIDFVDRASLVGTGNPAESNLWDFGNAANPIRSQTAGATRYWAAGVSSAATTYAIATSGTGTVGVGQSVTISPDGPYTGTITLAATRGTLSSTVLTFSASATPHVVTYTPTSAGAGSITGVNSGGLADPAPRAVTIVTTPATTYALAAAGTGTVGVGQTVTVTPDHPYTGTITLAATRGTLSATVLTFAGSAAPQSVTYTPTSAGAGSITGTNGGGLADPAPAAVTIATASATTFAFALAATAGQVGVGVLATITPDGAFTGTVALSASGGTFSPASLAFSASATPQSSTFTPIQVGTLTLAATAGGALIDPAHRTFTATASPPPPATRYTLGGPAAGLAGVPVSIVVVPDGLFTGTVTLHATGAGGVFTPAALHFVGDASPQSSLFLPTAAGVTAIAGTNDGAVADPAPRTFTATTSSVIPLEPGQLTEPMAGALTLSGATWLYVPAAGRYAFALDAEGALAVATTFLPSGATILDVGAGLYSVTVVQRPARSPLIALAPFGPA